jgi:hypothetical protein
MPPDLEVAIVKLASGAVPIDVLIALLTGARGCTLDKPNGLYLQ